MPKRLSNRLPNGLSAALIGILVGKTPLVDNAGSLKTL
jgi:hypothetical protein